MNDNRLVKNVVFGIIDGLNRRERPIREWMDDIKECCWTDAQTLSIVTRTGPCGVATSRRGGIGCQRAQAHEMKKKNIDQSVISVTSFVIV